MKTLNIKILFIALLALTGFSSCMMNCVHGSNNLQSEDRKVENFTGIHVSGDYKITLKQDSSLTMHITADDNLLKYIRTSISGNTLKIDSKKSFCTKQPVTITIGVRNLEELKGSGAIEFISDGKLNVKDMDLRLSGAGKIDLDLNATNVTTHGSGATEIKLKGQATSHAVSLTGSGKLDALDFVVNKYDIQSTGATECKINVLTELNIHSTGAADIKYKGAPTTINQSKTGALDLKKID
jgi:hypothetical protein